MNVTSLNIGLPKKEVFHGKELVTALCKQPVVQAVFLTKTGFNNLP